MALPDCVWVGGVVGAGVGEEVEEPLPIPSPTPPREGLGEREGVSEKVWVWTCVTLPNSVGEGP